MENLAADVQQLRVKDKGKFPQHHLYTRRHLILDDFRFFHFFQKILFLFKFKKIEKIKKKRKNV